MKSNKSILFVLLSLCLGVVLAGCDPNPGGLSDEQKLKGAHDARQQQMGQQAGNMPMSRDALPGANNGK